MMITLPKKQKKVNKLESKKLFYFLLVLAFLRPSLDLFSQIEFQIHSNLPLLNFNLIIGGLVFLISALFFLKHLSDFYDTPLLWPIIIFLGLIFISIFYSIDQFNSIRELIRLSSIFLLYFLAYKLVENKDDWLLLLKVILFSYLLPGAVALFQFIFRLGLPDDFGGFERIYGTFAHPNPFAFYTFFVLALALSLILSLKTRKSLWLFTAIMIFLLFATYTRSALACFFIFLAVFGIFKYRKLIIFALIIFLLFYFFSEVFRQRLWELVALDPYGSIIWRFRLWRDILPVSLWRPWLGYGSNSFSKLTEFYRGFQWGSLEAHNDYLKIFVENGIIGLAVYFWLIVSLFCYLFKIFRKTIGENKSLSLGILIIVFSLLLTSCFDNVLRGTALQWNLWMLLGGWIKINR